MDMKRDELIKLLEDVTVMCRDNGREFDRKNSPKIKVIFDKLGGCGYDISTKGVFFLCHKKPYSEYGDNTLLISTHIDCKQRDRYEAGISKCFSRLVNEDELLGTYDNSITNAAVLYLMMHGLLPDNVLVAFTGDEEEDSSGAYGVAHFLKEQGVNYKCIVLDVTNVGAKSDVDFTIENNFWNDLTLGNKVIDLVSQFSEKWIFVPEDIDDVPSYVDRDKVHKKNAEPDETWDYDEEDIECFSLDIPVKGKMHSDAGVYAKVESFINYIEILRILANAKY